MTRQLPHDWRSDHDSHDGRPIETCSHCHVTVDADEVELVTQFGECPARLRAALDMAVEQRDRLRVFVVSLDEHRDWNGGWETRSCDARDALALVSRDAVAAALVCVGDRVDPARLDFRLGPPEEWTAPGPNPGERRLVARVDAQGNITVGSERSCGRPT